MNIQIIERTSARVVNTVLDVKLMPDIDFITHYAIVIRDGKEPLMLLNETAYQDFVDSRERAFAWSGNTAAAGEAKFCYKLLDSCGYELFTSDCAVDIQPCFFRGECVRAEFGGCEIITFHTEAAWANQLAELGVSWASVKSTRIELADTSSPTMKVLRSQCAADITAAQDAIGKKFRTIRVRDIRNNRVLVSARGISQTEVAHHHFFAGVRTDHESAGRWLTIMLGKVSDGKVTVLSKALCQEDLPAPINPGEGIFFTRQVVNVGETHDICDHGVLRLDPRFLRAKAAATVRIEEWTTNCGRRAMLQAFSSRTAEHIALNRSSDFYVYIMVPDLGVCDGGLVSQSVVSAILRRTVPEMAFALMCKPLRSPAERTAGPFRVNSVSVEPSRKAVAGALDGLYSLQKGEEIALSYLGRTAVLCDRVAIKDFLELVGAKYDKPKAVPQKEISVDSTLYQVFNSAGSAIQNTANAALLAPDFKEGEYVEFIFGTSSYRLDNRDDFIRFSGVTPSVLRIEISDNGVITEAFSQITKRAKWLMGRAEKRNGATIAVRHIADGTRSVFTYAETAELEFYRLRDIDLKSETVTRRLARENEERLSKPSLVQPDQNLPVSEHYAASSQRHVMTSQEIHQMDVTKPPYYQDFMMGHQWLEAMQYRPEFISSPQGFLLAVKLQVMKYLDRLGGKDDVVRELTKARWYLDFMTAFAANGYKPIRVKDIPELLKQKH